MKKTTRQAILEQQELNRKIYNKENKENIAKLKDKIQSQKEVILNLKMELWCETESKEVARRGLRLMYKKYQALLLNADELGDKLEKHINNSLTIGNQERNDDRAE